MSDGELMGNQMEIMTASGVGMPWEAPPPHCPRIAGPKPTSEYWLYCTADGRETERGITKRIL